MELPTTSYAILGMLSLRPWTAYELTRQLRRSLDLCWPKAESVLYDEPKRLVRLGLATARREPAGRRTRTVYEITGRGRAALADWMATHPAPPRFESEPMLRLLYADQGSKQDALRAVAALRDWTTAQATGFLDQAEGYLDDGGPFPERLHIIALFGTYYLDLLEATRRWTERAEAEIDGWPRTDGLGMTAPTRELLEDLAARLRRLAEADGEGLAPAAGPAAAEA
jgi:PadR family transcriptional regulator AphA